MSAYLVSARAWVAESRTDVESSTILTTCVAVGGRKGDVSGSAQRPAVAHKKREGDAMCMRAEHAWHAQHYNRLCARANVWLRDHAIRMGDGLGDAMKMKWYILLSFTLDVTVRFAVRMTHAAKWLGRSPPLCVGQSVAQLGGLSCTNSSPSQSKRSLLALPERLAIGSPCCAAAAETSYSRPPSA